MTSSKATAPLKNGLMISWNKECFRSSATGAALGIPVHYIWPDYGRSRLGKIRRYFMSFWQSLALIYKSKPDVVVVHNLPPFVLMTAMLARVFNRHRIIMDFHSGALTNPLWTKFKALYAHSAKAEPFTLAHNRFDGEIISAFGGHPIHMTCLPRAMPEYPRQDAPQRPRLMVVCSFAADEPIELFWEVARQLPDVDFAVTGNYKRRGVTPEDVPANVILLGFIDRSDYFKEMAAATAVVTLSDRPNIMQMAIHEAVSLGVPVLTNRSQTTEPLLEDGGVFCDLTSDSLAEAVRETVRSSEDLRTAARGLMPRRIADVQRELDAARAANPDLFKPPSKLMGPS